MKTNYRNKLTKPMQRVEEEFNTPLHVLLRYLFVVKDMEKRDIANLLSINRDTVSDWLLKCGIYSHRLELKKRGDK